MTIVDYQFTEMVLVTLLNSDTISSFCDFIASVLWAVPLLPLKSQLLPGDFRRIPVLI